MTAAGIYMDAVLQPSRSLSARGFNLVMLAMGGVSFAMGIAFLSAGFTPIAGFLGLDILLLWWMFRRSFRELAQRTYVRVTASSLDLRHIDGRGRQIEASLPSAFARVELDEKARPQGRLLLAAGDKAYIVGKFLTPEERASFAASLRNALLAARSERHIAE